MNSIFSKPTTADSFLPADYVHIKTETRANLFTLTLFAFVMAATVATFLVTVRHRAAIKERATAMDEMYKEEAAKIEELRKLESQRAQMMEKAEITAALIEQVPRWALMAEVTMRMPSNMRLDGFGLKSKRLEPEASKPDAKNDQKAKVKSLADKSGGSKPGESAQPKIRAPRFEYTLTLAGTAHNNNEIADYLAQLKEVPMLERVELQYIRESKDLAKKPAGGESLRRFEIVANVRTVADSTALANSLRAVVAKRAAEFEGSSITADAAGKEKE